MTQTARSRRVVAGGVAVGFAAAVGFATATASADPGLPPRPTPAPPPVTQNVIGGVGNSGAGNSASAASLPLAPNPASPLRPPTAVGPVAGLAPVQPTLVPATSGTLRDYFQSKGVKLEPQKPEGFKALDITLPMPAGWTPVPDPNVADPFVVIANRSGSSLYTSNAQVVVYKLIGDFDPREAITHGFVDSQQLPAWQTTTASLADFGGFPSSIIEGTYRQNDMTLNTSRRHVIATSGPDKYLVSLAVTTDVARAVAEAPATDAIVNGFRVTAPTAAPPAPASPATLPAAPALGR
ncbi:MAG TPA: LpqN/LpqT family lipoprotein [Mycobacterium sp.]|uniref:LpqN/LpqT family lipoprotein n=1 Tax=Mycobacterium sp. TaxID=1785 RepID=UPI002D7267B5|nr:LpqN/LpqT family lipoprotein [Mycobacterium sp.]HZU46385.1 LpqN/LpqT family lipoprotein [Mycobacterium sp.]